MRQGILNRKQSTPSRKPSPICGSNLSKHVPQDAPDYVEAQNKIKAMAGLIKMLDSSKIEKVLAELEDYQGTTLGDLLAFMQAFNLRFAAANSYRQRQIYQKLYPMLAEQANGTLGSLSRWGHGGRQPGGRRGRERGNQGGCRHRKRDERPEVRRDQRFQGHGVGPLLRRRRALSEIPGRASGQVDHESIRRSSPLLSAMTHVIIAVQIYRFLLEKHLAISAACASRKSEGASGAEWESHHASHLHDRDRSVDRSEFAGLDAPAHNGDTPEVMAGTG